MFTPTPHIVTIDNNTRKVYEPLTVSSVSFNAVNTIEGRQYKYEITVQQIIRTFITDNDLPTDIIIRTGTYHTTSSFNLTKEDIEERFIYAMENKYFPTLVEVTASQPISIHPLSYDDQVSQLILDHNRVPILDDNDRPMFRRIFFSYSYVDDYTETDPLHLVEIDSTLQQQLNF